MFNFASLMLAGSAAASLPSGFYGGHGSPQSYGGSYNSSPSHYGQSHQEPQHSRYAAPAQPSYGGQQIAHPQEQPHYYNQQKQSPYTQQGYHPAPTQQPAYGNHHYSHQGSNTQSHEHADPWNPHGAADPAAAIDYSTWYNPSKGLQFSPAKIAFKSTASEPTFASCGSWIDSDDTTDGAAVVFPALQFMQLPHKPTFVKMAAVYDFSTNVSTDLDFFINEFGVLTDSVTILAGATENVLSYCAANDNGVGEEYNPLKEFGYYGGENPYQDFSRGTIDTVVGDDMDMGELKQYDLLQNLDDLIGRSITFQELEVADGADDVQKAGGCCAIVRTYTPAHFKPQPKPVRHW